MTKQITLRHPINTSLGIIKGRDAIYLDKTSYINGSLILKGTIVQSSCSKPKNNNAEIKYILEFNSVLYCSILELDFIEKAMASSFDEIINSAVLQIMLENDKKRKIGKINAAFRHFGLLTYDDYFEIICKDYTLTLN